MARFFMFLGLGLATLLLGATACTPGGDDRREDLAEQEQAVRTLRAAEQQTARQELGDRDHTLMRIPEGEPPTSMPVQPPPAETEHTVGEPLLGPPYSPPPPPAPPAPR
jgi:hypothetical protein